MNKIINLIRFYYIIEIYSIIELKRKGIFSCQIKISFIGFCILYIIMLILMCVTIEKFIKNIKEKKSKFIKELSSVDKATIGMFVFVTVIRILLAKYYNNYGNLCLIFVCQIFSSINSIKYALLEKVHKS